MKIITLYTLISFTSVFGQDVINVDPVGSYASEFPEGDLRSEGAFFGRTVDQMDELFLNMDIEPSLRGSRAIPTNSWWSDLLFGDRSFFSKDSSVRVTRRDSLGGNIWYYPGMVAASNEGLNVFLPDTWVGGNIKATNPLLVGGLLPNEFEDGHPLRTDVDNFEQATYADAWKLTGDAIGNGPRTQEEVPQFDITNIQGNRHLTTYNLNGKGFASRASFERSYTQQRKYLDFTVGGGDSGQETYVSVSADGAEIFRAFGENGPTMRWVRLDLSTYQDQEITLRLVDNSQDTWGFIMADNFTQSDEEGDPNILYNINFTPTHTTVTDWGDWHVRYDLHDAGENAYDITLMRGSPAVWFTQKGEFTPSFSPSGSSVWTDSSGGKVTFPANESTLILEESGRRYAILAPPSSSYEQGDGGTVLLNLPDGEDSFVVLLLAPDISLSDLEVAAWQKPTGTKLSWNYLPNEATVETTFTVETENLLTGELNLAPLMGWLPHHYDAATLGTDTVAGGYKTARGVMTVSANSRVVSSEYHFPGLLPIFPDNDSLDSALVEDLLASYPIGEVNDPETYAGGRALLRAAKHLDAAHNNDSARAPAFQTALEEAFEDWFTYDGPEDNRYFARYPGYRALVGYRFGFGSQAFNDHHFHYGYFTTALALLAEHSPEFVANYGNMATLVAKEYANWDRSDTSFPFLRNFDTWEGHSWAGGTSSPNGQNQESSSEAIQSWVGLFLLGSVLGDDAMRDAGAMGYAVETAATSEYWYRSGGNFPETYPHEVVGILGASGLNFGTFFGDNPAWIFGIQWTPSNLWWDFLIRDRSHPSTLLAATDQERVIDGLPEGVLTYQGIWTHYALNLMALADPTTARTLMEESVALSASDTEIYNVLGDTRNGLISYTQILGYENHGIRVFDAHTSMPTSAVYEDLESGLLNYIIHNPTNEEESVTLYRNNRAVGSVTVAPGETSRGILEQYDQWINYNYPNSPLSDRLPRADVDQDGISNLTEYALGQPVGEQLPLGLNLDYSENLLELRLIRQGVRSDVLYLLENSTNLEDWNLLALPEEENSSNLLSYKPFEVPEEEPTMFYRTRFDLKESK